MKLVLRNNQEFEADHIEGRKTEDGRNALVIYSMSSSYEELQTLFNNHYNVSIVKLENEIVENLEFEAISSNKNNQFIVTLLQKPKTQMEIIEELQDLVATVVIENQILNDRVTTLESELNITLIQEETTTVEQEPIDFPEIVINKKEDSIEYQIIIDDTDECICLTCANQAHYQNAWGNMTYECIPMREIPSDNFGNNGRIYEKITECESYREII